MAEVPKRVRSAGVAVVLALVVVGCRDVSGPEQSAPAFVHVGAEHNLLLRAADGSFQHEITVDVSGLIQPVVVFPACSPDGKRVTYRRIPMTGSGSGLFLVNSDGSGLRELVVPGIFLIAAAWSPDGNRFALLYSKSGVGTGVAIMNIDGSAFASVAIAPVTGFPSWSPDAREILYWSGPNVSESSLRGVFAVDVATGATRQIAAFGSGARWSPDGQQIAFLDSDVGGGNLVIVNKDGTSRRELVHSAGQITPGSFTWSPDGRILFETGGKLYFVDLNGTITPLIPEGFQIHPHWCGTP